MTQRKNQKLPVEHCDGYKRPIPLPSHPNPEPSVDFPYEQVFEDLDGEPLTLNYDNQQAVTKFFKQLTSFVLSPTNNKRKSQRVISLRFLAAVYLLLKKDYDIPNASAFLRICNIRHVKANTFINVCNRLKKHFNETK